MSGIQGGTPARGKGREDLLVLLEEAQSKSGYLSEDIIAGLAESVAMSLSDVYGVATFYSFLSTKPLGRNVVRICQSLPCYLKDSRMIIESVADELGIKPGETTPDGKFSFALTNCIGACDEAPAMLINNDMHGNLTPAKIVKILKSYQ